MLERMRLLHRSRAEPAPDESDEDGRPHADEAPEPQPEREEPRLEDPSPGDLSRRDYGALLKRAGKGADEDHITNPAAPPAHLPFPAIPPTLPIAAGGVGAP